MAKKKRKKGDYKYSRLRTKTNDVPIPDTERRSHDSNNKRKRKFSTLKGVLFFLFFVLGVGAMQYFDFFKNLLYPVDKYEKEKLNEIIALSEDLNSDTLFCKLIFPQPTTLTKAYNWIPGDLNVYETCITSHSFYDFPLAFYPENMYRITLPKNPSGVIKLDDENDGLDIVDINDTMQAKIIHLKIKALVTPSENHNTHSHIFVSFSRIYFTDPPYFTSRYKKYSTNPFIPDSIKFPLVQLLSMAYKPVSLGRAIKQQNDEVQFLNSQNNTSIDPPAIIILSRKYEHIRDTLTERTLLYEPYNNTTYKTYGYKFIYGNHFLLMQRLSKFMYPNK